MPLGFGTPIIFTVDKSKTYHIQLILLWPISLKLINFFLPFVVDKSKTYPFQSISPKLITFPSFRSINLKLITLPLLQSISLKLITFFPLRSIRLKLTGYATSLWWMESRFLVSSCQTDKDRLSFCATPYQMDGVLLTCFLVPDR